MAQWLERPPSAVIPGSTPGLGEKNIPVITSIITGVDTCREIRPTVSAHGTTKYYQSSVYRCAREFVFVHGDSVRGPGMPVARYKASERDSFISNFNLMFWGMKVEVSSSPPSPIVFDVDKED